MSALRQMFSLPLASGSLGARGRRVGGGDLWLRELSLGLSARGLQRSSVPTHSLQILRSTFGLSTSSLGTAGSRLRGASLLPKGFRRGSLIALAHQNGPGTGGGGAPFPGGRRARTGSKRAGGGAPAQISGPSQSGGEQGSQCFRTHAFFFS